jgi:hypothetical protein
MNSSALTTPEEIAIVFSIATEAEAPMREVVPVLRLKFATWRVDPTFEIPIRQLSGLGQADRRKSSC